MFHTGYSYSSMRNYGKPAITDFVKASDLEFIPDKYGVKIIISHLAKPFLTDLIGVINRQSLAYTDSSGLFDSKYEKEDIPQAIEDVTRVLGECGPKKLLFGTDFPVQTHEDSIYVVEEAMRDFHPLDKKEVYYYNASRLLYKLEL